MVARTEPSLDERAPEPGVALVTGGGRGLGAAICEFLVRQGWAVALTGRRGSSLKHTANRLTALGGRVLAVSADVTSMAEVDHVIATVFRELGEVNLLVNNAGCTEYGKVWDTDPEDWWRVIEVNLRGPFLCSRAVLSSMLARGSGCIVNIATTAADLPAEDQAAYSVSKAGLVRLTDSLASEVAAAGIHVFAISPGLVKSDMGLLHATMRRDHDDPPWTPMSAAANLILRLASGELDRLNGRFLHVSDNIDALRDHAGEVLERDLYQLRVHKL